MKYKLPYWEQKNSEVVDVGDETHWQIDPEYNGMFQKGARDKTALFGISPPYNFITPTIAQEDGEPKLSHRYLYKLSNFRFPEQFWVEVFAYRFGCLIGVPVPPAFVAVNSSEPNCGALIEWFYGAGQGYHDGGLYMKRHIPDFDDKEGVQHNWETMETIRQDLQISFEGDWFAEWARIFIFDALIGNTDRHQDNWGIVISYGLDKSEQYHLSPAFDNGTSMGHELLPDKHFTGSGKYTTDDHLKTHYIRKGIQHMKWTAMGPRITFHEFIAKFIVQHPEQIDTMRACLDFSLTDVEEMLMNLATIDIAQRLSEERARFMVRLLRLRRELLLDMLEAGNRQ